MDYKNDKDYNSLLYSTPSHYKTKYPTKNVGADATTLEKFVSKHGVLAGIWFMIGEMQSKIERIDPHGCKEKLLKNMEDCIKIVQAANCLNSLLLDDYNDKFTLNNDD